MPVKLLGLRLGIRHAPRRQHVSHVPPEHARGAARRPCPRGACRSTAVDFPSRGSDLEQRCCTCGLVVRRVLPDFGAGGRREEFVHTRPGACVPCSMLRDGECVGLLSFANRTAGEFSAKEIALAESFRDQALDRHRERAAVNETREASSSRPPRRGAAGHQRLGGGCDARVREDHGQLRAPDFRATARRSWWSTKMQRCTSAPCGQPHRAAGRVVRPRLPASDRPDGDRAGVRLRADRCTTPTHAPGTRSGAHPAVRAEVRHRVDGDRPDDLEGAAHRRPSQAAREATHAFSERT